MYIISIWIVSRYPLEVTDEFVHQFNTAVFLHEIEKLEATAKKMLARAKVTACIMFFCTVVTAWKYKLSLYWLSVTLLL